MLVFNGRNGQIVLNYLVVSEVHEDARKRALLLHLSGAEIQYKTPSSLWMILQMIIAMKLQLTSSITILHHRRTSSMRDMFRQAEQAQGESMDSFVSRLKKLAPTC